MKVTKPTALTLVSTNVPASAKAEWNAGTTYAIGTVVKDTRTTPHREYESAQGSNLNHDPKTSPTWWTDLGATNQYKMLDDYTSSQTTNSGSIAVTLSVPTKGDTLGLFGLTGESVRVVSKSGGVVVSDETYDLATSTTSSWSDYFFAEFEYRSDIVIPLLGYYNSLTIELTITAAGTASCGHVVVGLASQIGDTQYGAKVGILDFSVKNTTDFGDTELLQRGYAKKGDSDIWVPTDRVDQVTRKLYALRATPCLWNMNNDNSDLESLIVFGFFRDISVTLQYESVSLCNVEIEGLA